MATKKNIKEAVNNLDKFFSVEEPKNVGAKSAQIESKSTKEEAKKKSTEKLQKKVFSFRAEAETVDSWRLWADAKGMKVDDLGEKALQEYIKRHPLSEDQKQIYDLKKKQKS